MQWVQFMNSNVHFSCHVPKATQWPVGYAHQRLEIARVERYEMSLRTSARDVF